MASLLGNLLIKISADSTSLQKGLQNARTSMKKTADSMQRMGRTLTASVTLPLLAVGGAAIKMAVDAVESENLFEVSMGNMADAARGFSEELRKQLGLNAFEVRKNIGVFNIMLDSLGLNEEAAYNMSTSLTLLAYDMASLYNLPTERAFEKISSGLVGMIRPLRELGINVEEASIKLWALNKGLIEEGQQMSQTQKVMARYAVLVEQTAKAQGDLWRTLEDPANIMRILRSNVEYLAIKLGMALMPAFRALLKVSQQVIEWIEKMIERFGKLDAKTIKTTAIIAGIAIAIGPVLIGIAALIKLVEIAMIGFAAIASPVGIAIASFLFLAGAMVYLYNTNEAAAENVDVLWKTLSVNLPGYIDKIRASVQFLIDMLTIVPASLGFFADIIAGKKITEAVERYKDTLVSVRGAVKNYETAMENAGKKNIKRIAEFKSLGETLAELFKGLKFEIPEIEKGKYSSEMADIIEEFKKLSTIGTPAVNTFKDAVKSLTSEIKQQTESFMNFIGMFDIFARKAISGERLMNRMKAHVKAMTEWRQAMITLEERGISKILLEQIRSMGPQAVDQAMALAKMTTAQLAEYGRLYGQRVGIAGEQAGITTMRAEAIDTMIEKQINIYITDSTISSEADAREMANKIVRELRLAGVEI